MGQLFCPPKVFFGKYGSSYLGMPQFDLSVPLLGPFSFDILSNLGFLLVEKYRSKYNIAEVKSVGRSTEEVEYMKMVALRRLIFCRRENLSIQKLFVW